MSHFFLGVVNSFQNYAKVQQTKVFGTGEDINTGLHAATLLYHFGEHYAKYKKEHFKKDVKPRLIKKCSDYQILGNIVDASKHYEIDRNNPVVTSASSIKEMIRVIEYEDNDGEYRVLEKNISILSNNNENLYLIDLMVNVINMWFSILYSENIIPHFKKYTIDRSIIPPRPNKTGISDDLKIIASSFLPFHLEFEFFKYDNVTRNIYPKPLVSSARMPISFTNSLTNEKITSIVELLEDEYFHFTILKSDEDKEKYLHEKAIEKGVLIEMYKEARQKWNYRGATTLAISGPSEGDLLTMEVELDDSEFVEFHSIIDESSKDKYLFKVAKRNGTIDKMLAEAKSRWNIDYDESVFSNMF